MALLNGQDLKRMLRQGWIIINANPTIGFNAFVTELSNTTEFGQAEWMDGLKVLIELGYFPPNAQWSDARDWFLAQTAEVGATIVEVVKFYFTISSTMQIQLLTFQRTELIAQRDTLVDTVMNYIDPFIASLPAGTDQWIIDALQSERSRIVTMYQQLNERIADIDARLAELTG